MFKMLKKLNKKIVSSTIASALVVAVIVYALVMLSKNNFSFKKTFKEVKETLNECTGDLTSGCGQLSEDDCEARYKIDSEKGTHRCTWRADSNDGAGACKFITKTPENTQCQAPAQAEDGEDGEDADMTTTYVALGVGGALILGGGVAVYSVSKSGQSD